MNILVTGANGFIGRHLVNFFKSMRGAYVLPIPHNKLSSINTIESLLQGAEIDYIFHLAAYGNMSDQKEDYTCIQSNILNTYNLLEATRGYPYKMFVNVSTSSVYGKVLSPMKENFCFKPWTMYAATKGAAELIARVFAKQYNKPVVSARLFSVYGPGEADFRFIPTVIRNLLNSTEFRLDKHANHSWIYIDDVISALWAVAQGYSSERRGGVINIGNWDQSSNIKVVDILENISGKKAIYLPIENMRSQDSPIWIADNSRLRKLGWKSQWTLEEGLANTFITYKKLYDKK